MIQIITIPLTVVQHKRENVAVLASYRGTNSRGLVQCTLASEILNPEKYVFQKS